jgi:hypothetical protein
VVDQRAVARPGSGVEHAVVEGLDAVTADLVAGGVQQFGLRCPVAGDEAMTVRGGGVAWRLRLDDRDAAVGAAEHERGAQARRAADDGRESRGSVSVSMHPSG